MADSQNTTSRDAARAEAFRTMEEPICDLASAGSALELIFDGALGTAAEQKDGMFVYHLTDREREALAYLVLDVADKAAKLRRDFYEKWEAAPRLVPTMVRVDPADGCFLFKVSEAA